MSEYTAELYVHAMAIESEAAARYAELARAMAERGNPAVASLFSLLAAHESRHLDELRRRSAGLELPPLDADYTWRDAEAPESITLELDVRITHQKALALALEAEKRARAFFENASRVCGDAETRALAGEMALEEAEHVALIERMMQRGPAGETDWRPVVNSQ